MSEEARFLFAMCMTPLFFVLYPEGDRFTRFGAWISGSLWVALHIFLYANP